MSKSSGMSPEMVRNFVIRTIAYTRDRDVVSKDAALINPKLTPTVVEVVGSLVTHPITQSEEQEFGELAKDAIDWVKRYTGKKEFVLNVKDQLNSDKPNPNILVWIWKLYAAELGRVKHLDHLRETLSPCVDDSLVPVTADTVLKGLADLKMVTNGYQGSKVLHMVDQSTKRYIRHSVYGSTTLVAGDVVSYSGKCKYTALDLGIGLNYVQLTRPKLVKV